MAHSSSGLGRRPLKAEITGSNPVCATTYLCHTTSGQVPPGPNAFCCKPLMVFDDNRRKNRLQHSPFATGKSVLLLVESRLENFFICDDVPSS